VYNAVKNSKKKKKVPDTDVPIMLLNVLRTLTNNRYGN